MCSWNVNSTPSPSRSRPFRTILPERSPGQYKIRSFRKAASRRAERTSCINKAFQIPRLGHIHLSIEKCLPNSFTLRRRLYGHAANVKPLAVRQSGNRPDCFVAVICQPYWPFDKSPCEPFQRLRTCNQKHPACTQPRNGEKASNISDAIISSSPGTASLSSSSDTFSALGFDIYLTLQKQHRIAADLYPVTFQFTK